MRLSTAPMSLGGTREALGAAHIDRRGAAAEGGACRWRAPSHPGTSPDARSPWRRSGTGSAAGIARAGGGDADRGMRVGEVAARRMQAPDFRGCCRHRRAGTLEQLRSPAARPRRAPSCGRSRGSRAWWRPSPPASRSSSSNSSRSKLELTWMSMLGDRLGSTAAHRHVVGVEEARQDVVAVGADDQPRDRQPHPPRRPGGQHVAEIAGRARRTPPPGPARPAPARRRRSRGSAPRSRAQLIEFTADSRISSRNGGVGEHRLHQVLAVVERALDRDVADIRRRHRRHLPALHLAGAAVRVQDDDVDARRGRRRPRSRPSRYRRRSRRRWSRARRARASTWSNSRPSSCIAMSLKASVGPWNSSCTNSPVSSWTSGTTAGWPKPA